MYTVSMKHIISWFRILFIIDGYSAGQEIPCFYRTQVSTLCSQKPVT